MNNVPPCGWRADTGYLPPLGAALVQVPPPPAMYYGYGPILPPPPMFLGPPTSPLQPEMMPFFAAFRAPLALPAPPAPQAPPASSAQETPGLHLGGGLRAGTNYLYPGPHASLHIVTNCDKPWDKDNVGRQFQFYMMAVSTTMTVKQLIQQLGKDKDWAVTEAMEAGDGKWFKGTTVKHKDDSKSNQPISKLGWTEKRNGQNGPPVWVVLHKA